MSSSLLWGVICCVFLASGTVGMALLDFDKYFPVFAMAFIGSILCEILYQAEKASAAVNK